MAVLKYKDPTSGAVVTVGAPKVDTYSKGVIDNLLTNKANTDLSNVSASALSAAIKLFIISSISPFKKFSI